MKLQARRLRPNQPADSILLRRYMGGTVGGFYLVILGRWYLLVDWIW